jgi:competence protein ComEA
MAMYTRRQAALLLMFVVAAGAGMAIGHWRRAHPELAADLERLDEVPADSVETVAAVAPDPSRTGGEPRERAGPAPDKPRPTERGRGREPRAKLTAQAARAPRTEPEANRDDGAPVDLNRASAVELTRLPGIGPVLAARIVAARESSGPFSSVDDLRRVGGIGPGKLDRVRPHVTVTP